MRWPSSSPLLRSPRPTVFRARICDGFARWEIPGSHPTRSVLYTVQSKGSAHLYRQRVDGGTAAPVTSGPGRVGSWSIAGDERVAYGFSSPHDLAQLYVAEGEGATQLTHLNDDLLNERDIAEVEAFLTKPLGLAQGSTHPSSCRSTAGPTVSRDHSSTTRRKSTPGSAWLR